MNRRFTRFLLFAFLMFPSLCFSQGEWNNWYFGNHAAMTFNFGNPVAVLGSAMLENESVSSTTVSDSLGNLLFYSQDCRKRDNHKGYNDLHKVHKEDFFVNIVHSLCHRGYLFFNFRSQRAGRQVGTS
jgi:hypothetical protein